MTLLDATKNIRDFDREHTIYAVEPWSSSSAAMVTAELPGGGVPPNAEKHGMCYFLEVFIAQDFLADWEANLAKNPLPIERCQRLIDYATNDA